MSEKTKGEKYMEDPWYRVALDIETVRDYDAIEDELARMPTFSAPSNWRDEAKIAAKVEEKEVEWRSDVLEGAALSPRTGMVASIALRPAGPGWEDEACICRTSCKIPEAELLKWAMDRLLGTKQLITFNGLSFDGPFIRTRCLKNSVMLSPLLATFPRYRNTPQCDLRMELGDWDRYAKGTLQWWSVFLGLPDPGKTDPEEIQQWFDDGEDVSLSLHTIRDADATAVLYNRLTSCGLLL